MIYRKEERVAGGRRTHPLEKDEKKEREREKSEAGLGVNLGDCGGKGERDLWGSCRTCACI